MEQNEAKIMLGLRMTKQNGFIRFQEFTLIRFSPNLAAMLAEILPCKNSFS